MGLFEKVTLERSCSVFLCSKTISDKCKSIISLADKWDVVRPSDSFYLSLPSEVRNMLDRFWAIPKPSPENGGHWVGEKGKGVFYFDSDFVPSEKNNRNGWTWSQLVSEYKKDFRLNVDGGIRYNNFRIDIKPYAVASVKIQYENSDLSKLRNRGGSGNTIQELAAPLFEKVLHDEIIKGGYSNFWEYKDGLLNGEFVRNTPLVIHEDYDGETLYLVPKYLHDNWKHYGGVALVGAIIGE